MLTDFFLHLAISIIFSFVLLLVGLKVIHLFKIRIYDFQLPLSFLFGLIFFSLISILFLILPDFSKSTYFVFLFFLILIMSLHKRFILIAFLPFITRNFVSLLVWFALILQVQLFSFMTPNNTESLPDGPYVFKELVLPVKIQKLTLDYPPDNAIPAVVSEYLAQRIPFEVERPVMPGQELSNRPILQSLVNLPVRLALSDSTPLKERVERFTYVGISWPNTLSLISEYNFRLFLDVSIPLNSFLGALLFSLIFTSLNFFKRKDYLNLTLFSLAFIVFNPFLIFHSLFTWPKNLSASLIIVSLYLLTLKGRTSLILGSLAMGFSFLAHPMALPFILFTTFLLIFKASRYANRLSQSIKQYSFFLFFVLLPIVPWFLWTNYVLKIPSDLILQNTNLNLSFFDQIWIRISNAFTLLFPTQFSGTSFVPREFLWKSFTNIWSPLGLLVFFIPVILFKTFSSNLKNFNFILYNVLGGSILSALFFSVPTIVHIHGWQTFWPVFAAASFFYIIKFKYAKLILLSQLIFNLLFLTGWLFAVTEINF